MIALLGGVLTDDLLREVAGRELSGPLSLLHAVGTASRRDKHLLFLAEQGRPPFALVKWARGLWAEGLVSEQAAMRQVRASPDRALAASCPPSWGPFEVGMSEEGAALVTVERYFPSRSAYSQLRASLMPRRLVETHFREVSAWLMRFGRATLHPARPLNEAMLEEYVAAPLREFRARFGEAVAPAALVEELVGVARSHLGRPVPLTAEHGDLWPSNVLLPRSQGRGLRIVDWEHYRPVSLGGFDMLFFCTTYAQEFPWRPLGWMEAEVALRRAFVERTWLARHVERLLDENCAAIGLPRALVRVLLPVMMARLSLRHADSGHERIGGGVVGPEGYWPAAFRAWTRRSTGSWLHSWAGE